MKPDKFIDSEPSGQLHTPNFEYVKWLVETHEPKNRTEAMSIVMNEYNDCANPDIIAVWLHEICGAVE